MEHYYVQADAPEIAWRGSIDILPENLADDQITAAEDERINRAANRGKALQADVLAGGEVGAVAIQELRKIGLKLWQRERRAA